MIFIKIYLVNEYVHIVCLDCPEPVDYGGAIDMYHKVLSLQSIGKKIILHYFNYKAGRAINELANICEQIYSYKRKKFVASGFTQPYIVGSRIDKVLVKRLNDDDYPVILEGIHCSGILPYLKETKKVVIRIHNDEAVYYQNLAIAESNALKKAYYKTEARLLKKYQQRLKKHYPLACLSLADAGIFKSEYHFQNVSFIPCFVPWQQLNSKTGKGEFFLYHGNMTIKENEAAAIWLIENVFNQLNLPFVIAGKGISERVKSKVSNPHIKLISDPSTEDLNILIRTAHANVLPSMNATGVKLKLLHALFEGRFCFTNEAGIKGSGLEDVVETNESAESWIEAVKKSVNADFDEQLIQQRNKLLDLYNNKTNAEKLSELL